MNMKQNLQRIQRMLATYLSLGNHTEATEEAVLVTNSEFPLVPEANLAHTIRLKPRRTADDLLLEIDPELARPGSPWRHVVSDPDTRPRDLGQALEGVGFVDRSWVAAVHESSLHGERVTGVEVRGIAEQSAWTQFSELRREILTDAGHSGEELEQLATLIRRRSLSSNVRYYMALQDFEPVGHVGLLSVGRTGMLVDLAVRPQRRGAGLGRALIRRMVETSREQGHDFACVVYDDEPRLNALFTGTGFERAARFTSHRLED